MTVPLSSLLAILAVLASSLVAIVATFLPGRTGTWLHWIFKPLTTLLVFALLLPGDFRTTFPGMAVAAGLLLSLAGDIFLMLPGDRFLGGLASFLLAHVAYVAAFSSGVGLLPHPWVAVPYALATIGWLPLLWPGLRRRLRMPVVLYSSLLALMAAQAGGRALELGTTASLLGAVGAALFLVSDSLLALDRFRVRFRWAKAAVLATYWAAQALIALSAAGFARVA